MVVILVMIYATLMFSVFAEVVAITVHYTVVCRYSTSPGSILLILLWWSVVYFPMEIVFATYYIIKTAVVIGTVIHHTYFFVAKLIMFM